MRLASGRFQRGMKLKNIRTGRLMSVQAPVFFLARERNLAEEAWPGDIIGIPNHGSLRIGDTLTESEALRITGLPSFAPGIGSLMKDSGKRAARPFSSNDGQDVRDKSLYRRVHSRIIQAVQDHFLIQVKPKTERLWMPFPSVPY